MLAPTRELVTAVEHPRPHRPAHPPTTPTPRPQVTLADGSTACAGDPVITRRNDRRLRTSATDWVKNGRPVERHPTSTATGRWTWRTCHTRAGGSPYRPTTCAEHVQLGYATTIHGGQGVTADTSHTVTTGAESRQQLYVALTRGRDANHLYLVTAGDGDEHTVITPGRHPPAHRRSTSSSRSSPATRPPVSATTTAAALTDPAADAAAGRRPLPRRLHTAAVHLLGAGLGHQHRHPRRPERHRLPGDPTDQPRLPHPARPPGPARRRPAPTPSQLLTAAVHRPRDRHRARRRRGAGLAPGPHPPRPATAPGPLPWLPGIPPPLRTDPQWGAYLHARREHVTDAAAARDRRRDRADPGHRPAWARQLLTPDAPSCCYADLAVFRAAHAVPDDDTRPTGPRHQAAADRRAQRPSTSAGRRRRWTPATAPPGPPPPPPLGLTPATDPHWPALVEQPRRPVPRRRRRPRPAARAVAEAPATRRVRSRRDLVAHRPPHLPRRTDPRPAQRTGPTRCAPHWLPTLTASCGQPATGRAADRRPALARRRHRHHPRRRPRHPTTDLLRVPARPGRRTRARARPRRRAHLPGRARSPTRHPPTPTSSPSRPRPAPARGPAPAHHHPAREHARSTCPTPPGPPPPDTAPRSTLVPDPVLDDQPDPLRGRGHLADWTRTSSWRSPAAPRRLPAWRPTDAQIERTSSTGPTKPTLAPVPPERIAALNEQAAAFYQGCYPGSWSADLPGRPPRRRPHRRPEHPTRATPPPRWTALTDHLRRHGATDEELLAAGLAKTASTGRLIDTFRDRLILPIHTTTPTGTSVIVGFVARRNPATTTTTTPAAGPEVPQHPRHRRLHQRRAPVRGRRRTTTGSSTAPPRCSSKAPSTPSPSPSPAPATSASPPWAPP